MALKLGRFGGGILRLPAASAAAGAPPIDGGEVKAIADALKPPKRQRPMIAVIGINDATETTDYLIALSVITNILAFWKREELGIELSSATDAVWLALVRDAWSRTYRSRAVTFASAANVESRNGIRTVPDRISTSWPTDHMVPAAGHRKPAAALDHALAAIRQRFGAHTASAVAIQLEYPQRDAP